jgi:arylsulfatase B
VGFHRDPPTNEIVTPNIDALVGEGVELTRHYVYMSCTPSRSSVQSGAWVPGDSWLFDFIFFFTFHYFNFNTGRLPVHVQQTLANPDQPNAGIPRNMTGMASKLKQAGYVVSFRAMKSIFHNCSPHRYATHFVGKWDAGMATPTHTPQGRGYDTSLNYFEHKNDYWTQVGMQVRDKAPTATQIEHYITPHAYSRRALQASALWTCGPRMLLRAISTAPHTRSFCFSMKLRAC